MTSLYSVTQIREIELAALASLPPGTLMQRAGQTAAQRALELLALPRANPVLVLAGPGNNGGDALEAAYLLSVAGVDVTVILQAAPSTQPLDARQVLERARSSAVKFTDDLAALVKLPWALVIDGLFGIGLTRPLSGQMRELVTFANSLPCPVLALDVPSGLNADTGTIVGPEGVAIRASHTLTFIADKPGLHTCDGRDYGGQISVAALDIDANLFPESRLHLNAPSLFAAALQPRAHNSHKGSFGDVIVIGGAKGMQGAALLAARAALYCGAGRVFVGFIDAAPSYDSTQPELMCRHANDLDFSAGTVVIGPGAGTTQHAAALLSRALASASLLVIDADALNLLAADQGLQHQLARRNAASLLTPHPLEAARLLAISAKEVQADRLSAAVKLARTFNAHVILKGSGTVLASADGAVAINPTGNPGLATAGTGDVLAGVCSSLLAQQVPAKQAALASVWLHGRAADVLVAQGVGPIGLTAGELLPAIRAELNLATGRNANQ
jgi:hydroxyethylthiazole kinase-like uncharacterized protein yjeF